jgi:uncharacterized SAM-binding protein YcdF (DUF218 family)
MFLRLLLKSLLLPPAINLLVIVFAMLLARRFRRFSWTLIALSTVSLWLLSTAVISSRLAGTLHQFPAISAEQAIESGAGAIVVLGSSHLDFATEYGAPAPNDDAMVRLHYTANLHRRTGIPVMLTGGPVNKLQHVHAEVLARALEQEYGLPVKWLEQKSATTWQNALYSAEILHQEGIRDILLLTHSHHMPRAVHLFEIAGFNVTAAPTRIPSVYTASDWRFWLPGTTGLDLSADVLHEYLGLLWYRFVSPVDSQLETDLRQYAR